MAIAVDPSIGGLLVIGPKGTGKTSIVRAFSRLLPEIEVVDGCPFNDDPSKPDELCYNCKKILKNKGSLPTKKIRMKVVELPIGATEDMVLGTINVERTLREGRIVFEPGILAKANRNILYIDEVNLLPDHIVDSILDAAASGINIVEREGISLKHPARFILIGTMNPEEGELRPQLLDRFSIGVRVETIKDPDLRQEIIIRNIDFERQPEAFYEKWRKKEEELRSKIIKARQKLNNVKVSLELVNLVARVCSSLEVDGYRPDIVTIKIARALAALSDRSEVTLDDVKIGLQLTLLHRSRAGGLKPPPKYSEIEKAISQEYSKEKRFKTIIGVEKPKEKMHLPPFITFFR
ncbi:MAG: magnesium chelatase [Thermoprotei archaeon]|nr:MAG: magnesium chelatase [Thermoprotei archaeon]